MYTRRPSRYGGINSVPLAYILTSFGDITHIKAAFLERLV